MDYGISVKEAKEKVFSNLEKGCHCPLCEQYVRLYKIHLTDTMIRVLLELYKEDDFIHIPTELSKKCINSRSYPKLVHWRLIQQKVNKDTKKRCSGYWKITQRGKDFLQNKISVRAFVGVYNNTLRKKSKRRMRITDIFNGGFDYRKI